jgi:two-component system OmpR family response regulator
MKLLLVEDDAEGGAHLAQSLAGVGHVVDHAATGREGLNRSLSQAYDVVILDRMLPQVEGLTILRTMRASGVTTPVLVLTALGGIDDRVEGLEAGGDDYLVKPFAFAELSARINALGRRPPVPAATILEVGDLKLDLLRRVVTRGGVRIDLQPREFQLLEYLARNAGRVVTRSMLLQSVWGFHFEPRTNIVETHVSRLRSKVDRAGGPELIHTVRGAGYRLQVPD